MSIQTRKPGEFVFCLLLVVFSGIALLLSYDISGFDSISAPGVLPLIASALMLGSTLFIFRGTWALPPAQDDQSFVKLLMPKVIVNFLLLGAMYVVLLSWFGFLIASFTYLFVSILYLHQQGWLVAFFVSANALAIIYMIFRLLFKVILPEGALLE